MDALELRLTRDRLAVVRLDPSAALPDWALTGGFVSLTRTPDELSIVCAWHAVPGDVSCVGPWRAFVVQGSLDLEMVGVMARLATVVAAARIPLLAISTHDTDWLLVREQRAEAARAALVTAGIAVRVETA